MTDAMEFGMSFLWLMVSIAMVAFAVIAALMMCEALKQWLARKWGRR